MADKKKPLSKVLKSLKTKRSYINDIIEDLQLTPKPKKPKPKKGK